MWLFLHESLITVTPSKEPREVNTLIPPQYRLRKWYPEKGSSLGHHLVEMGLTREHGVQSLFSSNIVTGRGRTASKK